MSISPATSYTEQLKEQLAYASAGTDRIIVAHANPNLLARLDDAFPETPILDCPQSEWQLGSGDLLEAMIQSADSGVTDIVISGDSTAFAPPLSSEDDWGGGLPDTQLVDQVKLAAAGRVAAQQHFADQVETLISNPEVAARLQNGSLGVTALLYRAEADVFMVYQTEEAKYELLAS